MPVIKLVDVPSVVCKPEGGPGQMKAEIWPAAEKTSAAYMKVGDGACGDASEAHVPAASWQRPGPATRADCQDRCDANATCAAYDFCAGPGCPSRCRLYPQRSNGSAYNESVEAPQDNASKNSFAIECFAKQVANHTKPHVATFYRTSSKEVSISFTLTDSHPEEPRTLVRWTNVTLQAFSRRLDASSVIGAKRRLAAPIRRGKGAGGHGGHGSHGGGKTSSGHVSTRSGRMGGHTRSGEMAAGRFSNPGNARLGSYGYSQRAIASRYPAGYSSTAYGYSGLSSYSQAGRIHVASNTMSVIYGMYLFNRMGEMSYGMHHYHRYAENGSFSFYNLSNSTDANRSTGKYDISIQHDPGEGELQTEPFHDGVIEVPLTEDLRQDDMMATGFIPEMYTYPLILTVESVEGADYDHDRICPPAGWHPNASLSADPSWTPPGHQDLFFSLTQLEEFDHSEELEESVSTFLSVLFAILIFGVCFSCCGKCCSESATSARELRHFENSVKVQMSQPPTALKKRESYVPVANKLGSKQQMDWD